MIQIGLSEAEAAVYEGLLSLGQAPAQAIIKKVGLKKPTVYHILNQFVKRGLAEAVKGTAKKQFRPTSPENLEDMVLAEAANAERAKKVLEYALPGLISQYALVLGRPHVASYEGLAGIKKMHDDMIREGKNILLIQSPYDKDFPETKKLVDQNIAQRIKAGIHTRAITPLLSRTAEILKLDKERLIERRVTSQDKFLTPAQIIIYGDKTAITTYREPLLTTIIENKDIRDTFAIIFEYIWRTEAAEHQEIVKEIIKK